MEKSPKIPKIYTCEACCYSTRNKKDITKHYDTIKHKNNTDRTTLNEKIPTDNQQFSCPTCEKTYKAKNSLWYHSKKCKPTNTIHVDVPVEAAPKDDSAVIKELLKQNNELHKQILELSKEGKQYINNTMNNTKNFNLNFFLNETCKDAINLIDFVLFQ